MKALTENTILSPITFDPPGSYTTAKNDKEGEASLRPPSYTDRILCHSQPDCRSLLTIEKYDMCDAVACSDHRPVSCVIDIRIKDSSYQSAAAVPPLGVRREGKDAALPPTLPDSTRLVKIRIYDLQLKLQSSPPPSPSSSSSHTVGKVKTCVVYFPLQSEDPLALVRKPFLMNQALNSTVDKTHSLVTPKNMQYIHYLDMQKSNGFLEFRSLACLDSVR